MNLTNLLIFLAIGAVTGWLTGQHFTMRFTFFPKSNANRSIAMLNKTFIVLVGASALLSNPAFAAKPSFNCGKSTHEIEQLICSNNELAEVDVSLNNLYNTLLKNTPAKAQKRLKTEQTG